VEVFGTATPKPEIPATPTSTSISLARFSTGVFQMSRL